MSEGFLAGALTEVARAEILLVASDFDGVLAPFVLDPLQARPQEGTIATLRALAASPGTHAAVVSGRDLATLSALTGLDDEVVTRIGSHGAESSRTSTSPVDDEARTRLRELVAHVERAVAERAPHLRLEHKPTAIVVHTRGLDPEAGAVAEDIAADAARRLGARRLSGKGVEELSVVPADKGSALRALADELGASATVYLGDDVTDEHAFAVLGPRDVGIKVGPGETLARWRVAGPQDVPAVLAELRAARCDG